MNKNKKIQCVWCTAQGGGGCDERSAPTLKALAQVPTLFPSDKKGRERC